MKHVYRNAWLLAVMVASVASGALHTASYKSAGILVAAVMLGAVGAAADIARRERDAAIAERDAARAELKQKEEGK